MPSWCWLGLDTCALPTSSPCSALAAPACGATNRLPSRSYSLISGSGPLTPPWIGAVRCFSGRAEPCRLKAEQGSLVLTSDWSTGAENNLTACWLCRLLSLLPACPSPPAPPFLPSGCPLPGWLLFAYSNALLPLLGCFPVLVSPLSAGFCWLLFAFPIASPLHSPLPSSPLLPLSPLSPVSPVSPVPSPSPLPFPPLSSPPLHSPPPPPLLPAPWLHYYPLLNSPRRAAVTLAELP